MARMRTMIQSDNLVKVHYYRGYMFVYGQRDDMFFGNVCWVVDTIKVHNTDREGAEKAFEEKIDMMLAEMKKRPD